MRMPRIFTDPALWYRNLGLRARFALHIAGSTVFLLFGLIMPAVVYLQTQAALQQARRHGLEQTKIFAHASVQSLVMDDFLAMRHIVNSIASDPEVLYVMIHDREGRLLVHSDMRRVGEVLSDPLSAAAARADKPLVQVVPGPGGYAEDFAVPVYVMNEAPAVARIGISFAEEMAWIRQNPIRHPRRRPPRPRRRRGAGTAPGSERHPARRPACGRRRRRDQGATGTPHSRGHGRRAGPARLGLQPHDGVRSGTYRDVPGPVIEP